MRGCQISLVGVKDRVLQTLMCVVLMCGGALPVVLLPLAVAVHTVDCTVVVPLH